MGAATAWAKEVSSAEEQHLGPLPTSLLLGAAGELASVRETLRGISVPPGPVGAAVSLALSGGGKLLRPLCVVLSSRVGPADPDVVLHLSVATELLHEATLVHDDIIDEGELRRGLPAARVAFGNAAAVLAGDFMLVEALRHVAAAELPEVSTRLWETLARLVEAEALQLQQRGRTDGSVDLHDRIVSGKTAALFEFSMFAGATAASAPDPVRRALVAWASHAGLAFQIVDDLLDVAGDPEQTGKGPWNDLAQGKLSYPLLVALARDPGLAHLLRQGFDAAPAVARVLRDTGALDEARRRARAEAALANEALEALRPSKVRAGLKQIARAIVSRRR